MGYLVSAQTLRTENRIFAGTGGISRNNRSQDFQPGFYDAESGQVAISCFADGRPAPLHVLEGVPADWVTARNAGGGILSIKASVVSGFIRGGRFYTRAEAAALLEGIGRGIHVVTNTPERNVTFARLPNISPDEIVAHMSDPRVAEHMPLLTFQWDRDAVARFIAAKEACWRRDGLGHWAILCYGSYVGWGGFQREGDEWDFGLVLKPESFGLGTLITRKAIQFAVADERIPFVTFLLPPSRKKLGALARLGAKFVDEIEHEGARFLKYRLDTG